ncbi:MAG: hypothetical protein IJL91_12085, partial [Bacteroidales bacterium]|nr:hypothetical protein [Bacteroidales bacterium]
MKPYQHLGNRMPALLAIALACVLSIGSVSAAKSSRMRKDKDNYVQAKDTRGHVLLEEWARYATAQQKDRPQLQEEILTEIKTKARERRLSWDFWDAASQYVYVASSRNWKVRSEKEAELKKEVEEYDEPIVMFYYLKNNSGIKELKDYLMGNKERFLQSSNPAFWKDTPSVRDGLSGRLTEYFSNDYEYALWTLYFMNKPFAREEIKDFEAGKLIGPPVSGEQYYSYPVGAYFEYLEAESTEVSDYRIRKERREALEKVKTKYDGKAVSLYPRLALLKMDFDRLTDRINTTKDKDAAWNVKGLEQEMKDLYERCKTFEKERNHLSGEEFAIVRLCSAESLISSIERKSVGVRADGNQVKVILGNLYSAKVSIFPQGSSKKVFSTNVRTKEKRFYVKDTVTVKLPVLDDGVYEVYAENGKRKAQTGIRRYSLAIAHRMDSEGRGIYSASSKTGEPLKVADLHLLKNGSEVAIVKDFRLSEGFTHLPQEIVSKMNEDSFYELKLDYRDKDGVLRSTEPLSLYGKERISSGMRSSQRYFANLYLDKGAYNPGEVVHFKGVLGQGDLIKEVSCVGEGKEVKVSLYDSQSNRLEETTLKTNSFGSVAGEFTIPTGLRGGQFSVRLESESKWRTSKSIRVDEFVLPSFYLEFDKVKELYFPGDEVKITGKLKAYSGHSLSSAKATYVLKNWDTVLAEGDLQTSEDGSFSLSVPTDPEKGRQHISVSVKVIDDTGETQEYSRGVFVSENVNLTVELLNGADASLELTGAGKPGYDNPVRPWNYRYASLVDGQIARVKMTVRNDEYEPVPSEITYKITDENEKVIKEGKCASDEVVEIDMEKLGQGLYYLEAVTSVSRHGQDKPVESKSGVSLLYLPEDASKVDAPVDFLMRGGPTSLETGDNMSVQIASASAPLWAVVELFGDSLTLIESKMVHLEGKRGEEGSAQKISFPYKAEYPDAMRISVVFFRDGRYQSFQREYKRVRHGLDLPLEFTSFQDKAFPVQEYTLSLKSSPDAEAVMTIYDKSVDRIASISWNKVYLNEFTVPYVNVNAAAGTGIEDLTFTEDEWEVLDSENVLNETTVVGYGMAPRNGRMMAKSAGVTMNAMVMDEAAMDMAAPMVAEAEESMMFDTFESGASDDAGVPETVREDFATTLAFEPFIRTDADGNASVKFSTSDKLSTFVVKVYAHDKRMRNSMVSKEMVVSIPVKVAVAEPSFLYAGDSYNLAVTLSSTVEQDVPGTLTLYQYDGSDHKNSSPVASASKKVTVKALGGLSESFAVKVPSKGGIDRGLMVVFKADDGSFSDAVFVSVPVKDNLQTLTEAHSAVYFAGQDKNAIIRELRSRFVNVSGYGAAYDEISIIDMVKEAIPSKVEPKASDVLSLSEALYVRLLSESLLKVQDAPVYEMSTSKLIDRIKACKNADGGFGWFEGMSSSPIVTAVVLERFAKLDSLVGIDSSLKSLLTSSVKFLDKNQFDSEWPVWCGGLSVNQYLLV